MRLLLAHPYTSWNGVRRGGERYLDDLLAWAVGAGHEVVVGTGTDRAGRAYDHGGARVVELPGRGREGAYGAGLRALLVAEGPFDLMHALEADAALAGAASGCPVVFSVLGLPRGAWLAAHPSYRAELRAAGQAAAVTCALTQVAAEAVAGAAGLDRVEVLPPGLRAGQFPLSTAPRRPEVLFASVVGEQRKRFGALVAALGQVPQAGLVVAGPGDPAGVLAAHPAVAARTRVIAARREELPALYACAAVTALPSYDEAFGLVAVESLACGTPVLAAPGSGPQELLGDAGVGIVTADLAAGLRALLARPPDPAACRRHALRWDWSRVGPRHDEVWRLAVRRLGASTPPPD